MPVAGSVQKLGCTCCGGAQAHIDVAGDRVGVQPELLRPRAVDRRLKGRAVDFLLKMRVGDAGNGGDALLQLVRHLEIVAAVGADDPHVDLRRQTEIEDLRDDVGGLEIEHDIGKGGRQHLAQLAHVVGGRRVAALQRHHDHPVIGADGRAVGEGEIIGARRQPDIVDDQRAVLIGDDLADLVLDRLEDAFCRSRCASRQARARAAESGRRRSAG